jgi:putative DNA primase/helicase
MNITPRPVAPSQETVDELQNFFRMVVPFPKEGQDFFVQLVTSPGWRVIGYRTPERLAEAVGRWARTSRTDVYFCLSGQRDATKRSGDNAVALKSAWLDLDVKDKGYADLQEAAAAIRPFLAATGLPEPSVLVCSGGGLHVYFSFLEPIKPERWQPLADALVAAANEHGLRLDAGCTIDRARILRVPGTTNWKTGEARAVLIGGGTGLEYAVEVFEKALAPLIGVSTRGSAPIFEIFGGHPSSRFSHLPPDDALSGGINLPRLDPPRLRSAYEVLARAGKITERDGWRDLLLFPLTELAKLQPADEAEWKSLYDEVSALVGGDTTHNDSQWNSSMSSKVNNPRTAGSVFAAARELGWHDPAKSPLATAARSSASGVASNRQRTKIPYVPGEIARAAEDAEAALIDGGAKTFRRGSNLVRPEVVETSGFKARMTHQSLLRVATVPMLVRMLSQVAIFMRPTRDGEKPINPPEEVARGILAGQDGWLFPSVAGVITSPTLRPDGSILATEGYDPTTKLYVAKIPKMPPIPATLTKEDAARALSYLEALLTEFPFEDAASRSVALSGVLTTVCRGAFPVAPMHAITAPTPGSGKSYLIDVIAAIANGNFAAVFTWSTSMEENEKRIDGALLDGCSIIAIDNISMDFGGDKICQTVERPLASVRRLGQSDRFEVENRATVFATGNNLILKGDVTRRALVAVLDPRIDRPELRQFRRKPTDVVFANRGQYIAAALTVVAAYMQASQPNKLPSLASFEAWSDTIRSALTWLGRADPVETMKRVIDQDPDHQARVEFCRTWAALGGQARAVDQLIAAGEAKPSSGPSTASNIPASGAQYVNWQFRDALVEVAGLRGNIDKDRLAKWLRTNNGRVIEGRVVRNHKARKTLWSIEDTRSVQA